MGVHTCACFYCQALILLWAKCPSNLTPLSGLTSKALPLGFQSIQRPRAEFASILPTGPSRRSVFSIYPTLCLFSDCRLQTQSASPSQETEAGCHTRRRYSALWARSLSPSVTSVAPQHLVALDGLLWGNFPSTL